MFGLGARLDGKSALAFLLAGDATFTLVSCETGKRYTYKVTQGDLKEVYFVRLLAGPDNEGDYQYLGMVVDMCRLVLTRKSALSWEATPVVAFSWMLERLAAGGTLAGKAEFWHEGKCGRCGRKLTVPESIAMGLGPECAEKGMGG